MITSGVRFEKKSNKNDSKTGEVSDKLLAIPIFQK